MNEKDTETIAKKLSYYIIYSFDIEQQDYVGYYYPRKEIKRKMRITETESEYISENTPTMKHRKLVGELNFEELKDFLIDTDLYFDDVETIGSLTEFGLIPAFAFNSEAVTAFCNAYITPLIQEEDVKNEEDFHRVWEDFKEFFKGEWEY